MKRLVLVIFLASACLAGAQTDQSKLKEQIAALKAQRAAEVDRIEKDLKASKDYAVTLYVDLEKAQGQVDKVGTERDDWRDYGNDQHEKFMNAEVRAAKKDATILKLSGVIGLLVLAIGAYAFAKFYLRLPI